MILLQPIILDGFGIWTLRITDELRIAIFERKVLRKIHGPFSHTQLNEWRKLHIYEF